MQIQNKERVRELFILKEELGQPNDYMAATCYTEPKAGKAQDSEIISVHPCE
jgi:hypothetical protein